MLNSDFNSLHNDTSRPHVTGQWGSFNHHDYNTIQENKPPQDALKIDSLENYFNVRDSKMHNRNPLEDIQIVDQY
jgi:hypothetical protein